MVVLLSPSVNSQLHLCGPDVKIGILSDTHNNIDVVRRALKYLHTQAVKHIIHCGDITTPGTVSLFDGYQISFVYGNMDQDRAGLLHAVRGLSQGSIRDVQRFELGNKRIAACHGHQSATFEELVRGGLYDYVFYGHTHRRRDDTVGSTRAINPGALGGLRRQPRSVCVLDLSDDRAQFVNI